MGIDWSYWMAEEAFRVSWEPPQYWFCPRLAILCFLSGCLVLSLAWLLHLVEKDTPESPRNRWCGMSRRRVPPIRHGMRAGFTLIELLVVISILLILAVAVVYTFRASAGGDRLRSAGRTSQSAFLGAKDRALHAKEQRGIRLIRDPNDSSLVIGFAYVQPIEPQEIEQTAMQLERSGTPPNEVNRVRLAAGTLWPYREFLSAQPRIKIPNEKTGQWYAFNNLRQDSGTELIDLLIPFPNAQAINPPPAVIATPFNHSSLSALWEPSNELLPNHAPINMPSGVVIDLSRSSSNVQAAWAWTPTLQNQDIMYTPRGSVTGALSAQGPLHFLMRDIQDVGLDVADPAVKGEAVVLTLFPMTGLCQTYPVSLDDTAPADGVADNPFRFAQEGSRSGN